MIGVDRGVVGLFVSGAMRLLAFAATVSVRVGGLAASVSAGRHHPTSL